VEHDRPRRNAGLAHLAEVEHALLGGVAAFDRVLDTVRDVLSQDLLLDTPQRGAHRRDLRDDVDAVAVIFNHAREAPHLAFDAAEASKTGGFVKLAHALTYTRQGYIRQ